MQLLDLYEESLFASHGSSWRFSPSLRCRRSGNVSVRYDDGATSILQALWRRAVLAPSGKPGKLHGERSLSRRRGSRFSNCGTIRWPELGAQARRAVYRPLESEILRRLGRRSDTPRISFAAFISALNAGRKNFSQHLGLWEESQAPPESEPPRKEIKEITFDLSYSQLIQKPLTAIGGQTSSPVCKPPTSWSASTPSRCLSTPRPQSGSCANFWIAAKGTNPRRPLRNRTARRVRHIDGDG